MSDEVEGPDALRRKVAKAATYLQRLIVEGNVRLVTLDLFRLGTLGQMVAVELHKRLTAEQTVAFEQEMSRQVATDAPRIRQRRVLDDLVKLHDQRSCPS